VGPSAFSEKERDRRESECDAPLDHDLENAADRVSSPARCSCCALDRCCTPRAGQPAHLDLLHGRHVAEAADERRAEADDEVGRGHEVDVRLGGDGCESAEDVSKESADWYREKREELGLDVSESSVVVANWAGARDVPDVASREERRRELAQVELEERCGEVRSIWKGREGDGMASVVGASEMCDVCSRGRAAEDADGFRACERAEGKALVEL